MRDGLFGEGFDLAMMIYGQFNVFPRDRGPEILKVANEALSNEAYTEQELIDAIRSAGFQDVERFSSLSGKAVAGKEDLPVVVARS